MPENYPQSERSIKPTIPDLFPAGLAETGKKRVEDAIKLQTELFKYLQEVNRNWLARMKTEASMASEFSAKFAAARSIPETGAVCQEWANRHIELMAEDAKRLVGDTEKFMEAGAHILGNGWAGASPKR
jgi:hypothetical protein